MKMVLFILGFLTAYIGYSLIACGVKRELKFSEKFGGVKANLASVSLGLLFVLLGIFWIGICKSSDYINEECKQNGVLRR
jgi:hypothetical protein